MSSPGTRFSKVLKLFERISDDTILFVSSRRMRLEAQLFQFLFFLQHMKRPVLQSKRDGVLRMAFRVRKVFGTIEKRAPGEVSMASG